MFYAIIVFIFLYMCLFMGLGYGIDYFFPLDTVHDAALYPIFLNCLLGVGIYLSVTGIDLKIVQQDLRLALRVLSLGVGAKIVLIAGTLYLLTGNLLVCLVGIAVSQIDPISVRVISSKISGAKLLGKRAENILMLWATFDAPLTVLATTLFIVFTLTSSPLGDVAGANLFILNLLMPAVGYALIYFTKQQLALTRLQPQQAKFITNIVRLGVLLGILVVGILYGFMFAIALTALFIRPPFVKKTDSILQYLFIMSLLLVGTHVTFDTPFYLVFMVAVVTIIAQCVTAFAVTMRAFSLTDQLYLGFAQQNGLTAITLALAIGQTYPSTFSLAILSMVFINALHILMLSGLNFANKKKWIPGI